MDTAECIFLIKGLIIQEAFRFHLSRIFINPPAKSLVRIKKEITGSFAPTGKQSGRPSILQVIIIELFQINVRKNIYIMNQKRFI